MKIVEITQKISIYIIVILLIVITSKLINMESEESQFYEYKNSKINLKQVKKIIPRLEYIITYKEDDNIDVFRKYTTPLNPKEIKNVESFLYLAQKSEFYNVEVISFMLFDDEKIPLYHSQRFLKSPANYSVNENMLSKLSSYGLDDMQYENLKQLKKKVYNDANVFFEDVISYAKIKRSEWSQENIPKLGLGLNAEKFLSTLSDGVEQRELTKKEILDIVKELKKSYKQYDGIE